MQLTLTVIPRASASQKQAFEDLVNVTQVSTFFAAVVGRFRLHIAVPFAHGAI